MMDLVNTIVTQDVEVLLAIAIITIPFCFVMTIYYLKRR